MEVEELLFRGHPDVVDADLADYFGSIPHTDLLKSVAPRAHRIRGVDPRWLRTQDTLPNGAHSRLGRYRSPFPVDANALARDAGNQDQSPRRVIDATRRHRERTSGTASIRLAGLSQNRRLFAIGQSHVA